MIIDIRDGIATGGTLLAADHDPSIAAKTSLLGVSGSGGGC